MPASSPGGRAALPAPVPALALALPRARLEEEGHRPSQATASSKTSSELSSHAKNGIDGKARGCLGLGVVGVVRRAFAVGVVADVLDVEVRVQHPAVVDPALIH